MESEGEEIKSNKLLKEIGLYQTISRENRQRTYFDEMFEKVNNNANLSR